MQTFKKVILVVTCLVVLLTSFIQPSSAAEYYYDDYGDVWLKDDDEDVLYKEPYMEMSLPSMLIATEPNFPEFDPNMIPWIEAPSYVQDILYTPLPDMSVGQYIKNVPFVCVLRNASVIRVYAGYNLCFGRVYTDDDLDTSTEVYRGMFFICKFPNLGSSAYSVCYSADYNLDYTIKVPWRMLEATDYGNTGNVQYYPGLTVKPDASSDIYGYGANYGKEGTASFFSVSAQTKTVDGVNKNYRTVVVVQNLNGFESGRFVSYQDDFVDEYFQSFTPKSIQQVEQETQKGIWDSIKELPTKIADSIKGFFTSLGDRISGFFDNLINYLLYFQSTKPEHVNPFADILTDVKSFFNDQMSDVGDFKNSLSSTLNNVVTYIETGSGVVNTFLTAVPMLSAFITFFVVFCIVRKVIGR